MNKHHDVSKSPAASEKLAESPGGPRRWAVLATITFLTVVSVYNQLAVSILAPDIIHQLGITNAQLAGLLTAPMLSGVILAIPAGSLADRFGVKRVVTMAFIVSLAGLGLRIFADTYAIYFLAMFLLGWANIIAAANSARLLRAWFGIKGVGHALGIFLAAGPVGSTAAQISVSHFPSAQAFYSFGWALFLVGFILWLLVVRNSPAVSAARGSSQTTSQFDPTSSVLESVKSTIRNPHVLLVGLGAGLFGGAQFTVSGFLPVALSTDKGFSLAQAGGVAAIYTVGTFLGNLCSPIIAGRLGRVKPVIITAALLGAVLIYFSWLLVGTPIFPLVILLAGAALGATIPLIISAAALLPTVTTRHAGGAGGVIGSIEGAGVFAIPTLIVAPIAGANYTLIFLLAALTAALIALVIALVPEFGGRAERHSQEDLDRVEGLGSPIVTAAAGDYRKLAKPSE